MKLPTEGVHLPGLLHMSQVPPASYMLDERELKCSDPNPNPNPNPNPTFQPKGPQGRPISPDLASALSRASAQPEACVRRRSSPEPSPYPKHCPHQV